MSAALMQCSGWWQGLLSIELCPYVFLFSNSDFVANWVVFFFSNSDFARKVGLMFEGREHSGIEDARNTARLVRIAILFSF